MATTRFETGFCPGCGTEEGDIEEVAGADQADAECLLSPSGLRARCGECGWEGMRADLDVEAIDFDPAELLAA